MRIDKNETMISSIRPSCVGCSSIILLWRWDNEMMSTSRCCDIFTVLLSLLGEFSSLPTDLSELILISGYVESQGSLSPWFLRDKEEPMIGKWVVGYGRYDVLFYVVQLFREGLLCLASSIFIYCNHGKSSCFFCFTPPTLVVFFTDFFATTRRWWFIFILLQQTRRHLSLFVLLVYSYIIISREPKTPKNCERRDEARRGVWIFWESLGFRFTF